jgi:biopolymer transport protein ExbB
MLSRVAEYVWSGGPVNVVILAVCFVVVYIGLGKLYQYWRFGRDHRLLVSALAAGDSASVAGRVAGSRLWREMTAATPSELSAAERFYHNRLREVLLSRVPELESGLDTMAAWIAVAPLLGLLGTVVGMIRTFGIIMEFGVGNPSLLSDGISVALLTTEAGLTVAFPGLLFHNVLRNRKNTLVRMLAADGERAVAALSSGAAHV